MKAINLLLSCLFFLSIQAQEKIDRKALAKRNNVHVNQFDSLSSLSVGNGSFAFTVDATGLQSFPKQYQSGIPLGTQSVWGWHSFKDTVGYRFEETLRDYPFDGRKVSYGVQIKDPKRSLEAGNWFRQNPHRLQLGNLGFEFDKKDGTIAQIEDIKDVNQELDLWTGVIKSSFTIEGELVEVQTLVHPKQDMIAVKVKSTLLKEERIHLKMVFPFPSNAFADMGVDYTQASKHYSRASDYQKGVLFQHFLDSTRYFVYLQASTNTYFQWTTQKEHEFVMGIGATDEFSFTCHFQQKERLSPSPDFASVAQANQEAWQGFWTKGAAVDFSNCKDPRAKEIERRIMLSLYLTKIQCANSQPPQETGLTYNSWFGKPHLEMHWWHGVHFPLWNRAELLEKSMGWYQDVAPMAFAIAKRQGYKGLRWQKMTDPKGAEAPSSVGAFLIWQQPHYISFAELLYRKNPNATTLKKYRDLVFATADFMADYASWNPTTKKYQLGKGLIPAQERFKPEETFNPSYELAYWDWALKTAQDWRIRSGMKRNTTWDSVIKFLSPLPVQDQVYLSTESAKDSYTNPVFLTDHPSVLGTFGMLPNKGMLDTSIMRNTFNLVWNKWDWKDTWGWDFPMTAMSATRLGMPEKAVEALLMPIKTNTYLINGHNYQDARLRLYLPGNGGLLTAIAIMCAGYDGNKIKNPGFPKDGNWDVRWEGLQPFF
ncbi:MAG: hypothetical protein CFE25_12805 [Chitinophagaceae bacterium BSSC1]|nr:MAG: hypothetical protein CFE25_12805 [Chitinophagaceae bacterium BSSC1]